MNGQPNTLDFATQYQIALRFIRDRGHVKTLADEFLTTDTRVYSSVREIVRDYLRRGGYYRTVNRRDVVRGTQTELDNIDLTNSNNIPVSVIRRHRAFFLELLEENSDVQMKHREEEPDLFTTDLVDATAFEEDLDELCGVVEESDEPALENPCREIPETYLVDAWHTANEFYAERPIDLLQRLSKKFREEGLYLSWNIRPILSE